MEYIGIVGPSSLKETPELNKACKIISETLVKYKYGAIISPDIDSTAELFAKEFKKNKKSFILGIHYEDDTANNYSGLNRSISDKVIDCKTWENQPKTLVINSKAIIVLGLSVGVTWELCLTRFFWSNTKNKIFIIKETNNERLPDYLADALPIEYISVNDLDKHIKKL
jgi:hypothetical protein